VVHGAVVRVAIVTESFLPQINGVTNSVLRVCEQLADRGAETLVVAPGPGPETYAGARVVRAPSVPLPGYADFRLARPWSRLGEVLRDFDPDVVHLASPAVLGAQAAFTARSLGLPVVAVYQTDLAGFARRYGLRVAERTTWRWLRAVHDAASRTLAPSRHAVSELRRNGVQRVDHWARGVDLRRFAPAHRDPVLHARLAPDGQLLIGYVGRLAHEKEVGLLAGLRGVAGLRLVVVGDGPQRAALQRQLPGVEFFGFQDGARLATTFASLDVFVHTGSAETFCQAAQEALASGVPVVAPAAGGLLDLVRDGSNGRLFAPGSAASLRGAVDGLVRDPGLRSALAERARPSVEGRTWTAIGDQLVRHYEQVAA
jgi:phosphatidylinositol alpha 1,6-mannosyltransferase